MKKIESVVFENYKKVIGYIKDRNILMSYYSEFGKDPESVISKLKDLDILTDDDRENFSKFNRGLVGINTKDTSISMALEYLAKLINSSSKSISDSFKELQYSNKDTISDNFKVLEAFLDKDIVNANFNMLKNNLPIREYATKKIVGILATTFNPAGSDDVYINYLNSIMLTIKNSIDDVNYKPSKISDSNSEMSVKLVKQTIDLIKESSEKETFVTDVAELKDIAISDGVDIDSDVLSDYIISTVDDKLAISIPDAVIKLYEDISGLEQHLNTVVTKKPEINLDLVIEVNSAISKCFKSYSKDEITSKVYTKSITDLNNLLYKELNTLNDTITYEYTKDLILNRVIYVSYLVKSMLEKIVIESTL